MKILSISLDKNLFKGGSAARQRQLEYGNLVGELHILVLGEGEEEQARKNIWIYPAGCKNKLSVFYSAFKKAEAVAVKNKIDLITAQDPFSTGLIGWLLKRKLKIPLQIQIHTDFLSFHFRRESVSNKIRVILAKFLIPRADCIRVVSEKIKKSLSRIARYPLRVIVLPIFVDVKKIREAPIETDLHKKYPQFDFVILTASRLTREKNICLAIGAMEKIIKKHPKAGLIIVGEGPEEKKLKSQISRPTSPADEVAGGRANLKSNVIFEPWTSDLISYYKTADLFLLTSNYEGYGMAVVEAMASRCPVIMTDVGLANEVLIDKKDGLVVPVGNKEKLVEAIRNLIENSGLRARLIENAGKTLDFWPSKEQYLKKYRDSWHECGGN